MNENLAIIDKAREEFQSNTFFLANYIKCNLLTFSKISYLFINGEIREFGLQLKIDESIPNDEIIVGMGEGPTFSRAKIK